MKVFSEKDKFFPYYVKGSGIHVRSVENQDFIKPLGSLKNILRQKEYVQKGLGLIEDLGGITGRAESLAKSLIKQGDGIATGRSDQTSDRVASMMEEGIVKPKRGVGRKSTMGKGVKSGRSDQTSDRLDSIITEATPPVQKEIFKLPQTLNSSVSDNIGSIASRRKQPKKKGKGLTNFGEGLTNFGEGVRQYNSSNGGNGILNFGEITGAGLSLY